MPEPTRLTRRQFLSRTLGVAAGAGALGGVGVAQAYRFGVTQPGATLSGLRAPLRAAFLTDLHHGRFIGTRHVRAWVQAANAARPDVILLGGDYCDRRAEDGSHELLAELAQLRAPLGVFGVWGNHDYATFVRTGRTREQDAAAYARAGITLLRNEGRAVRDDLFVGGTDDFMWGQPDPAAALAGAGTRATLLLSHNPDQLVTLPDPVGLVLCGHTHGGQVRLPLVGALPFLVPSRYGARFDMGWKAAPNGSPAYVSRGLGVTGLPARNLCPPELTLLTLRPA